MDGGARRHQLEFHHLLAVALGELSTADVCLRCKGHNRYAAEQDFGQEHVAGKVASRRDETVERA